MKVNNRKNKKGDKQQHNMAFHASRAFALIFGFFLILLLTSSFSPSGFLGLFIASIPGLIIILCVLLSWNHPRIAMILFLLLTIFYSLAGIILLQGAVLGSIALPMIIISSLFYLSAKTQVF